MGKLKEEKFRFFRNWTSLPDGVDFYLTRNDPVIFELLLKLRQEVLDSLGDTKYIIHDEDEQIILRPHNEDKKGGTIAWKAKISFPD